MAARPRDQAAVRRSVPRAVKTKWKNNFGFGLKREPIQIFSTF